MASFHHRILKILNHSNAYQWFQHMIGDHSARQTITNDYLRPRPGIQFLDIGCGPGSIRGYLPYDINYLGIDINPHYVQTAREKFGDNSQFVTGSIHDLPSLDIPACDIVYAGGLLHHLNDEEVILLCQYAQSILLPSGRFISLDCAYEENQGPIARYLISHDRGKFVRTAKEYSDLLAESFAKIDISIRNDLLLIPYTHIIITAQR